MLRKLEDNKTLWVEGDSGSGKTTFIKRCAYRWATDKGPDVLKRRKLLLVLKARESKQGDVLHDIESLDATLFHIFKENEQDCLVCIDALDECSTGIMNKIIECISNRVLKCPVILTCRTYQCQASLSKVKILAQLNGFTNDSKIDYIEKRLGQNKMNNDKILKNIPEGLEFNPFIVSAICTIGNFSEEEITYTSIYRQLEDHEKRNTEGNPVEVDMSNFYKLCLLSMLQDKPYITDKDFKMHNIKEQIKYGFMKRGTNGQWEFLHQSFKEYFAACSLLLYTLYDLKVLLLFLVSRKSFDNLLRFFFGLYDRDFPNRIKRLYRELTIGALLLRGRTAFDENLKTELLKTAEEFFDEQNDEDHLIELTSYHDLAKRFLGICTKINKAIGGDANPWVLDGDDVDGMSRERYQAFVHVQTCLNEIGAPRRSDAEIIREILDNLT